MKTSAMAAICPSCAAPARAATTVGDRAPHPGDLSVCFHCGAIGVFTLSLSLTALTPAAAFSHDPHLVLRALEVSAAVRAARRRH